MALNDKDIDNQMAADWGAIREKFAVEEPESASLPPPETDPPEEIETVIEDRGDGRRPDGTFAPKKAESKEPSAQASPAATAAPASGGEPAAPASSSAPSAPVERDINKAPSTWKPAARAEYDKLSPAIKAEVHRREEDWMRAQRELVPEAQFGNSIKKVVEPYRMMIEAEGGTPERAIADLMRTAAILRIGTPDQKKQVLLGAARQFGIDIGQVAPSGNATPQQTLQDPRVDQLLQYLQTENQRKEQLENQEREIAATRWMEEVDEKGASKRPYLSDVMPLMQVLVSQIRQSNPSLSHEQVLQSAYEQAIWASPEVRPLLQAPAAAARPSDSQNRVRDAKRAASVNVPRRASQPSPGKPGTIDETIAETARTIGLIA